MFNQRLNMFKTQKALLEEYAGNVKDGLCVPLSNVYAKHMISNQQPKFLEDCDETYKMAVEEEHHQFELSQQGNQDFTHSAFIHIPHEDMTVDKISLTNSANLQQLFADTEHALITYPIQRENDNHMVYFGKKKNHCVFFDANHYGGEIKGPCPNIFEYMSHSIAVDYSDEEKSAKIGKVKHS
ncbi:MAG: hypothetical protein A3F11_06680 [Gammaproteobacteria bacterium RIFCSPHIGHO2_12_FULL_37_14]|nr:MAG: hypothetical protein A3F11_06680 [Gammaproteobacteria bacterium RIFCSPHIGHO2_12_FULL_37_14]